MGVMVVDTLLFGWLYYFHFPEMTELDHDLKFTWWRSAESRGAGTSIKTYHIVILEVSTRHSFKRIMSFPQVNTAAAGSAFCNAASSLSLDSPCCFLRCSYLGALRTQPRVQWSYDADNPKTTAGFKKKKMAEADKDLVVLGGQKKERSRKTLFCKPKVEIKEDVLMPLGNSKPRCLR